MSETKRLMNFEEFRAAASEQFGEAVRQQREFFRDAAAAEEILRPGAIDMPDWTTWDNAAAIPVTG